MKIEWLFEAQMEYRDLLGYYRETVGTESARKFAEKILNSVRFLEQFPEMGVLKDGTLLGRFGFRALFIGKYACIYRIEGQTVYIYHLADARTNYIYNIFGIENSD